MIIQKCNVLVSVHNSDTSNWPDVINMEAYTIAWICNNIKSNIWDSKKLIAFQLHVNETKKYAF